MKGRYWYGKSYSYAIESKVLKSGYSVAQTRKGLSKAWIGYTIAKNNEEHEKMKYYASVIR